MIVDKWTLGYKKYIADTRFLIDANAPVRKIYEKLISAGGRLICVDFVQERMPRLIGTITQTDLQKGLNAAPSLDEVTAKDIANKDCVWSTLADIETILPEIEKYKFVPVVDDNDLFTLFLSCDSKWSSWSEAQESEIEWWDDYFERRFFVENTPLIPLERIVVENEEIKRRILKKTHGASVLEIGAGPLFGFLWSVNDASELCIIEPLAEQYAKLRVKYNLDIPNSNTIKTYAHGADIFIPEFKKRFDLIICHNALDHTPDWMFVLGNIASYAKKGGIFYLVTDIDHHQSFVTGHYNITYNPQKLYRFLESLDFELIYYDCWTRSPGNTCVSIVSVKQ